jgi:hypothetical protein
MSLHDQIDKHESFLKEMDSRLKKVEEGNVVAPEKETLNGRLDRERDERAQKIHDKNSSKPQESLLGSSRPVSQKRWEEIKQRNHQLPAPVMNNSVPKVVGPAFTDVLFAAWKENKICLVSIKTNGPPNPMPNQ